MYTDGLVVQKKSPVNLKVEFEGNAHKLIAAPEDFFSGFSTAMPGDVFHDSVEIRNTTEHAAEIFFRTSPECKSVKDQEFLKKLKLVITMNDKKLYSGDLLAKSGTERFPKRRRKNVKLLSIAIPCYNSEAYMEHCINTLLTGGDEVEIIIVDDGSQKDRTPEIADEYERKYPGICRAVHQENGGHGQAVNTGLKNATGVFFKVVDSDDWVNEEAYQKVLETLRGFVYGQETLDMLVTNFVYEKEGAKRKKVMNYHTAFPRDKVFTWKDVKFFMTGQYILMHSVIYRTELLRQCGLELPMHTFYVDNIFVYQPLPHVKNMYYLDVNFYRYFIGRSDQSVNEQVMIGRIDQQLRVTKLMLGYYDVTKIPNRKLKHYMTSYLEIMMTICSVLAIKSGTEENMEKKKEIWEFLKKENLALWLRLRFGFLGQGCNLPGKGGRDLLILGYKITQKFYGFN